MPAEGFANSPIREQAQAQKDDVFEAPGGGPIEGLGVRTADLSAIDATLNRVTISDAVIGVETVTLPHIIKGAVTGLPVAGYKKEQPAWAVDLVNENKILEEKVLRQVDRHVRNQGSTEIDQCAVAHARTKIQEVFMWLNRGVFQPQRILGDF